MERRTQTVKDDRFYSYGTKAAHVGYGPPSSTVKVQYDKQQKIYRRRREEAEKRWQQVAELARQGLGDEEIGKLTGYSPNTVCDIVRKMRRRGDDIPPRKKGPRHG